MSDAAGVTPGASAPLPGAGDAASECGRESLNRLVERTRHAVGGARLTIEKCPDASRSRAIRAAAMLGGAAALGGYMIRRVPVVAAVAGLGGALVGALASRYHVAFDWDPDRAFGGERGERRPEPEIR